MFVQGSPRSATRAGRIEITKVGAEGALMLDFETLADARTCTRTLRTILKERLRADAGLES